MKKRSIMMGSAILLVVLLVAGGTFAWFTATAEPVVNEFKAGTVELDLKEKFYNCGAENVNPGDCFYKSIYVKNTGTKKSRVRVKIDSVFEDELATAGVVKYELNKNFLGRDLWKDGGDGYLYYRYILNPGQNTPNLLKNDKVCFDGAAMNNDYQGKTFKMTIGAEVVQATNGAPEAVWGAGIPRLHISPFSAQAEEFGLDAAPALSEDMIEFMKDNPDQVEE